MSSLKLRLLPCLAKNRCCERVWAVQGPRYTAERLRDQRGASCATFFLVEPAQTFERSARLIDSGTTDAPLATGRTALLSFLARNCRVTALKTREKMIATSERGKGHCMKVTSSQMR